MRLRVFRADLERFAVVKDVLLGRLRRADDRQPGLEDRGLLVPPGGLAIEGPRLAWIPTEYGECRMRE